MKPLKLNLGCGKNPMPGWLNVDKTPSSQGWELLPSLFPLVCAVDLRFHWPWVDGSVDLISISHLLYCLTLPEKIHVLCESCRVLKEGGILRITDDDNEHPKSLYHINKHHNSRERTSKQAIISMLRCDGFKVKEMSAHETDSDDLKILIDLHPDGPAIFFLEATRI